jgi:hypothetical protein
MVSQGESVNYQGRTARVENVLGEEPNQAVSIKFDDGSTKVVMQGELSAPSGSGLSGSKLNQEQISRGQSGGGSIRPPRVDNTLPEPERGGAQPKPTPYANQDKDYIGGMSSGGKRGIGRADTTEPPLGEGEPVPPLEGGSIEEDQTPNDAGPGTGDSGAGLKADGKDVDSARRRLLGTEEIVVYIEPVTRKIVDRNGRKIEIGTTVNLKARIIKFHGADKAEVLYPPYIPVSNIPVWSSERNRLENRLQDGDTSGEPVGSGVAYEGYQYSYKDGKVVDANGNEAKDEDFKKYKQEKLVVRTRDIEKF